MSKWIDFKSTSENNISGLFNFLAINFDNTIFAIESNTRICKVELSISRYLYLSQNKSNLGFNGNIDIVGYSNKDLYIGYLDYRTKEVLNKFINITIDLPTTQYLEYLDKINKILGYL